MTDPALRDLRRILLEALAEFEGRPIDEVNGLILDKVVATILGEYPHAHPYRQDLVELVQYAIDQTTGILKERN